MKRRRQSSQRWRSRRGCVAVWASPEQSQSITRPRTRAQRRVETKSTSSGASSRVVLLTFAHRCLRGCYSASARRHRLAETHTARQSSLHTLPSHPRLSGLHQSTRVSRTLISPSLASQSTMAERRRTIASNQLPYNQPQVPSSIPRPANTGLRQSLAPQAAGRQSLAPGAFGGNMRGRASMAPSAYAGAGGGLGDSQVSSSSQPQGSQGAAGGSQFSQGHGGPPMTVSRSGHTYSSNMGGSMSVARGQGALRSSMAQPYGIDNIPGTCVDALLVRASRRSNADARRVLLAANAAPRPSAARWLHPSLRRPAAVTSAPLLATSNRRWTRATTRRARPARR